MNELKRSQKRVKLKGKANAVVRELYLRGDILCHSPLCKKCDLTKTCLSKPMLLHTEATHYVIPCFDVVKSYLEILELPEIKGIIILQSITSKVLSAIGRGHFRRFVNLSRDSTRGSAVFLNEICEASSVERLPLQSEEEWLFQCVLKCANYYFNHLEAALPIIVVSENQEICQVAEIYPNIKVMSLREYLKNMCDNAENLMDLYNSITIANALLINKNADELKSYDGYHPSDALLSGVKNGRFLRGILKVNKHISSQEAYVASSRDGGDILIFGMKHRNRAIHGDDVVVEMLPKSEWKDKLSTLVADNAKNEVDVSGNASETSAIMPTGKVVGVLERKWRNYVATLPEANEENVSLPKYNNAEKVLVVPYDYRIPKIRIATAQASLLRNQRIIVRIDSWDKDSQYPSGHFVRALGELNELETEVKSLLVENGISAMDFPQSLLNELPKSTSEDSWKVDESEVLKRKDLRHSHLIFSIDPKGCEDVDDALSVQRLPNGNIELGVHIADVTFFVKQFSLTDLEAKSRSTSVYLPDRRYDMLPQLLSADLCSLLGNVDRYAVSVLWILDPQYNVLKVWYGRTVICSSYKLSYEDAEDILNGLSAEQMKKQITEFENLDKGDLNSRYDELKTAVTNLVQVSRELRAKRLVAGGLELSNINMKFEIDTTLPSVITGFCQVKELEVHKTVAECMIFANNWVAKKISAAFPQQSVLRRHPIPREHDLMELQKFASSKGFSIQISSNKELAQSLTEAYDPNDATINLIFRMLATRAMNEATYFCSGSVMLEDFYHYGLGISHYTHFTSPIRRYSDILVHRLLLASVQEQSDNVLLRVSDLDSLCDHMNVKHRCAQDIEKAAQELFQSHYFSEQLSKDASSSLTTAIVYAIKRNGLLVLTPRYGIKGAICLQNKDKKVAVIRDDGIHWVDGSTEVTEATLTIKTADTSQMYSVFDKITVSIDIQKSRAHRPKISFNIVSAKECARTQSTKATASNSQSEQIKIKGDETADGDYLVTEPDLSNKQQNLYILLHCFKQMTLQALDE